MTRITFRVTAAKAGCTGWESDLDQFIPLIFFVRSYW
jgi:hypothetical protein